MIEDVKLWQSLLWRAGLFIFGLFRPLVPHLFIPSMTPRPCTISTLTPIPAESPLAVPFMHLIGSEGEYIRAKNALRGYSVRCPRPPRGQE